MIESPHTYAQWAKLLKQFGDGGCDAEVVPAMKNGTLEWQPGVADRFSKHLSNALNKRIKSALDQFDTDLGHASSMEEGYVRSLNGLQRSFAFIRDAAALPCVPEEYRIQFVELVQDAANKAQQSLEDSAASIDRTERTGQIPSLVRNHPVNVF